MISYIALDFVVDKRLPKVEIYVSPLSACKGYPVTTMCALNYQIGIEVLTFALF